MIETNKIHIGDALELARKLDDESVQCIVTSPPYWGLRDYGVDGQWGLEKTPQEHVENMTALFRELNYGDCYCSKGGHYDNACNERRGQYNIGTRPEHEDRDFRIGAGAGLKPKDLVGMPWRIAFALQEDGWYLRQDIIWHKPNPMPESVKDRCTKAHEYLFLLSKSGRYFFDSAAIQEPATFYDPRMDDPEWTPDRKERGFPGAPSQGGGPLNKRKEKRSRAASEYPAQELRDENRRRIPSGWDTGEGDHDGKTGRYSFSRKTATTPPPGMRKQHREEREEVYYIGTRNKRSVWTLPTYPYPEAHFATFPPKLIEPCILAGTRRGDLVLDPFLGSGTTAEVAIRHGRQWMGFELNPEYARLAEKRIAQLQVNIF